MTVIIVFSWTIFLFTAVLPAKTTMDQQTVKLQIYTGKTRDMPIRSARFVAMMQTKGVYKSILGTREQPNEPAPQANGASNYEMKNHKMLKDAHEKEFEDTEMFKERGKIVWCHLALTLEATTPKLMRNVCVVDDGIGEGTTATKFLRLRFQRMEMPTVVTFVVQLA